MKDNQKELFIVVDKEDNILEYRTRYDCHHDKNLIHRAIGVIIYNNNGDILLQKRSKFKDLNPGKYTISASGHVAKGQSYLEAAVRETEEELGINIPVVFAKKFIVRNDQESEICVLFTAKTNGPFYPSSDEIDTIEFSSISKIKSMKKDFTPVGWESLKQMGIV